MSTTPSDDDDSLLKFNDVMARLKLGETKVKELVRDGHLPSVNIGRCVRVRESALRAFIASLR